MIRPLVSVALLVAAVLPLVAPPVAAVIQCWDYDGDTVPDNCGAVYPAYVGIIQPTPGGTPTVVTSSTLTCVPATQPEAATVSCMPPPGTWICANAAAMSFATVGTVTTKSSCTGGPTVTAIAVAWSQSFQMDMSGTFYNFPFTCQADFSGGATGWANCWEPVP